VKVLQGLDIVWDDACGDVRFPCFVRAQSNWQQTTEDIYPAPVLIPDVGNFNIGSWGDIHNLYEEMFDGVADKVRTVRKNLENGQLTLWFNIQVDVATGLQQ